MIRVQAGNNSPVTIPGATRMEVDELGHLLTLRDDDGKAVAYYREWSNVFVVEASATVTMKETNAPE